MRADRTKFVFREDVVAIRVYPIIEQVRWFVMGCETLLKPFEYSTIQGVPVDASRIHLSMCAMTWVVRASVHAAVGRRATLIGSGATHTNTWRFRFTIARSKKVRSFNPTPLQLSHNLNTLTLRLHITLCGQQGSPIRAHASHNMHQNYSTINTTVDKLHSQG